MTSPGVLCIIVPLAGACITFLAGRRSSPWLGTAVVAATLALALWQTQRVWQDGTQSYALGGWGAPLGIELYIDGFSCLMLLMTSSIMLVIGVYAAVYYRQEAPGAWTERHAFTPLWLFLFAALNSLFLSGDVFNLYISLELLTLAGVVLVLTAGTREALTGALRYLLAAFAASMLYLMGVALVYAQFGVLDLRLIAQLTEEAGPAWAALMLMTTGLMIKTALFPFHAWLPHAHGAAPSPVSAMLSGLVIKASFYVLLRLWIETFPQAASIPAAQVVGVMGAVAIVWGSLQALRETNVKLIIAHSTVSQVGLLFVVVPLVIDSRGDMALQFDAWAGGLLQVTSHAFAKASLFLAAGAVIYALGNDRLESLRGLTARLPMTAFAFGLAGVAIIGLPPSGSFIAKWLLLTAAVGSEQWWWAVVIAGGTLLSGAYLFRLVRQAFLPGDPALDPVRAPRILQAAALSLAVVALLLGLVSSPAFTLLEDTGPFDAGGS